MTEPAAANDVHDIADLMGRLRAALARGDDAEGERLAEALARVRPDHEPTLAYLSTRARLRGDVAQATAWAGQGLQWHPQSALLLFNRGAAAFARRVLPAAAADLESTLRVQPGFVLARFWLASVQREMGDHDASIANSLRALNAAERDGVLQTANRLPDEARQHIDAAIADVHRARGQAVSDALAPLRARHGDAALQRIDQALGRHTGAIAPGPSNPLQEPSFLFIPGLPDKPWWEREEFPFLEGIEALTDVIRAELLDVLDDDASLTPYIDMPASAPAAPIWRGLNRSPSWSAYHLFRDGERVLGHGLRCPRTAAALDALPLMRVPGHGPEALFSVLRPGTHIPPHTGVINGRLTVHLPLIVPPDCGALAVARQPRAWQEGRCLVFDDSYVHEAWNKSEHTRAVLIFDVWNPALTAVEREALSLGVSTLGEFNRRGAT